jgi:hypothetical protein
MQPSPESLAGADPERVKLAQSLADEVAAVASRTVFQAVMDGDAHWRRARWLFCLAGDSNNQPAVPWAKAIADDAIVMSLADLTNTLMEQGSMLPSNKELTDLAAACYHKLSKRLSGTNGGAA